MEPSSPKEGEMTLAQPPKVLVRSVSAATGQAMLLSASENGLAHHSLEHSVGDSMTSPATKSDASSDHSSTSYDSAPSITAIERAVVDAPGATTERMPFDSEDDTLLTSSGALTSAPHSTASSASTASTAPGFAPTPAAPRSTPVLERSRTASELLTLRQREFQSARGLNEKSFLVGAASATSLTAPSFEIESVTLPADKITEVEIDKAMHTMFAVEVRLRGGDLQWVIKKRYSDFRELHDRLKRTNASVKQLHFPKRHVFRNRHQSVIEQRRSELEKYINEALEIRPLIRAVSDRQGSDINMDEFLRAIAILKCGTMEDKLRFVFNMCDLDHTGKVQSTGVSNFLISLFGRSVLDQSAYRHIMGEGFDQGRVRMSADDFVAIMMELNVTELLTGWMGSFVDVLCETPDPHLLESQEEFNPVVQQKILANETHFNGKEVSMLQDAFNNYRASGGGDAVDIDALSGDFQLEMTDERFHRVFASFGSRANGSDIDVFSFVSALSVACRGSQQEKATFAYRLFATVKDGSMMNRDDLYGKLAEVFGKLAEDMWCAKQKAISPRNFKKTIGKFNEAFRGSDQQDSQEMLAFLLSGLSEDLNRIQEKPYYDLYGVVNHQGALGGGHYTAYAKNFLDDQWYYYDDERVRVVEETKVVTPSAYLLFYVRSDMKGTLVKDLYPPNSNKKITDEDIDRFVESDDRRCRIM
ncbi:hypothetical protein P43SY_004280 [Pythium insidiosum]|uniref:ubiquitinyl hydrolase 1 n=1 Tax=Pythium insidiosum TaxID=114742 RepID=A0AAD5Q671_PYTIN|nr:hypothetical protein P43SY_004280 [Pythium insidiosum]